MARSLTVIVSLLVLLVGCAAPAPTPTATKAPVAAPTATKAAAPAATPTAAKLAAPTKSYELKLSGTMPISHPTQKVLQFLADRIQELSQGKIKVTTYLGGSLFKDKEEVEGVRTGAVDMASHTFSNWNSLVRATEIVDVPYLFPGGFDQAVKILPDMEKLFDAEFQAKAGVKLLGLIYFGSLGMTGNSVREVKKPEDLKGLKMRGFSQRVATWLESVGASSVVLSSAEVYTALERGTIEGVMSAPSSFTSRKWTEVVKYITYSPSAGNMFQPVAVNMKSWNNLEPAAQQILQQAMAEAREKSIPAGLAEDKSSLDEITKTFGTRFYTVTPQEEANLWVPTAKRTAEEFYAQSGELGQKLKELIEKTK